MAAGMLQKPGSKYGTCLNDCNHVDCLLVRRMAASKCAICEKPIGYEVNFYEDPEGMGAGTRLVHEICLLDKIEQKKVEQAEKHAYSSSP